MVTRSLGRGQKARFMRAGIVVCVVVVAVFFGASFFLEFIELKIANLSSE